MMSKTKLLTILVLILVVINVVTLSFFISKRPHDRSGSRKMPREIVIRKLHFDAEQIAQYEVLIKEHREAINRLDNQLRIFKNNLYKQLGETNVKEGNNKLFLEIATTQATIEEIHFNHFLAIKKLCKPEQLDDFNNLTNELSTIFNRQPPPENRDREH